MKILFLGGNRFFGKEVLSRLLKNKKNKIYLVNRTKKRYRKKNLIQIIIDRKKLNKIEPQLINQKFDVVFDNIGYELKDVKMLEKILKNKVRHYIFTSSVMTYLNLAQNFEVNERDWFRKKSKNNMNKYYRLDEIDYAKKKEKIENYLINKSKLNYTILRIHNVIGKDDFSFKSEKLFNYNWHKYREKYFSKNDYIQFCFKDDLVKIIYNLISRKNNKKNIFNVSNNKIRIKDFYEKIKFRKYRYSKKIWDDKNFPLPTNIFMNSEKIEKFLKFRFTKISSVINSLTK